MDYIFKELNIKDPKEMAKVPLEKVLELGGGTVISKYKGSYLGALQKLYPGFLLMKARPDYSEIKWDVNWLNHKPKHYWPNPENQRKFLDFVAKILDIKSPEDWGKIEVEQVVNLGGGPLLKLPYYKGSLVRALHRIYPGNYLNALKSRHGVAKEVV